MITGIEKMPKPTAMHCVGDGHDMPVTPLTIDGIASEFQLRPTFVVCRMEPTPTAKQSTVVGHETEDSRPIPEGGDSLNQDESPDEIAIIVAPVPVLPLLPTPTQYPALEQAMLVMSTAFTGAVWVVQFEPLSVLLITKAVELRLLPAATQSVLVAQSTELNCLPVGM
jgi:hypothetical protein